MTRTALASVVMFTLTACAGGDEGPAVPPATVLVSDDAGRPYDPELSPDGTRLAYAMPVNGRAAIHVANADGSGVVQLTDGIWDDDPVWSPDGRWIAYYSDAGFDVFVVPSDGGEPKQLTSGPARDDPAGWLPDGSGVVFYRFGEGDVQTLVVPLAGGPPAPIVPAAGGNQYVVVSPDGTKAAFDLHRGGRGTIWVQDLAGGTARQITDEGLENALTSHMWSPDSRSLLYTSRRTGTTDLWIADVETGALRQLTSDVRNDGQARWSPDGRWVVFVSDRGGQADVWIVSAAGGRPMRVTNDLAREAGPQWSADGRRVVFERTVQTSELRVAAVDSGTERTLVRFEGYQTGEATLSPNGETVYFTSNRSGNWDLWSVPFGGGEATPVAVSPLSDGQPQVSPDGSMVVFVSSRAGSDDLWVVPATGDEPRQLLDWPSAESNPRWSPDGATIAFLSDHEASQPDVWIIPAAGGAPTRLTTGVGAATLRWMPDGASLFYVGRRPAGGDEIYRVPLAGGTPLALGAGQGGSIWSLTLSPDGSHVGYSAFIGGWAFVEVIPTSGGAPRRLTTRTETVYHNNVRWSTDGTRLVVSDYDYPDDSYDLDLVTWPDGVWSSLTDSPGSAEFPEVWTPDGRHLVYMWGRLRSRILSVSVAELLGSAAAQ